MVIYTRDVMPSESEDSSLSVGLLFVSLSFPESSSSDRGPNLVLFCLYGAVVQPVV